MMTWVQGFGRNIANVAGRDSRFIRALRPTYERVLDWRGTGIDWPINGVTYRIDPRHRHRFGAEYDAPVAAFLRTRVKPGAVCLDVGANVGVYVLQFAHWSAPAGRIIAFEPNPEACGVLARHVRLNGLTDRVSIVPAAVSDAPGRAVLHATGCDGMSRLGEPNRSLAGRTEEVTVDVITIDDYCSRHRLEPDWIVLDVEGFEINALAGAKTLIQACGPHLGIVVEMHPNVWSSAGITRSVAEKLLTELGRIPIPLTGQVDPLGEHGIVSLEFS